MYGWNKVPPNPYEYVKEYGEGVDRMCRELEAIGLPDPYFNNDTFILKTTVKSAAFDHESTQNASIRSEIASIRQENASIQQEKASIDEKKELMKKIDRLSHEKKITAREAVSASMIIDRMDILQVITSTEIMKTLDCQTTKARRILKLLENQGLIVAIQGKGKGKYLLNVSGKKVAD